MYYIAAITAVGEHKQQRRAVVVPLRHDTNIYRLLRKINMVGVLAFIIDDRKTAKQWARDRNAILDKMGILG